MPTGIAVMQREKSNQHKTANKFLWKTTSVDKVNVPNSHKNKAENKTEEVLKVNNTLVRRLSVQACSPIPPSFFPVWQVMFTRPPQEWSDFHPYWQLFEQVSAKNQTTIKPLSHCWVGMVLKDTTEKSNLQISVNNAAWMNKLHSTEQLAHYLPTAQHSLTL